MSAKKVLGIVLLCVFVGIVIFALFLYATVKTKSRDVGTEEPFSEWVGRTVTLVRPAVLFKEKLVKNNKYRYTLLDSLHTDWQYIERRKNLAEPDIEEVTTIPVGSEVKLEKAVIYTNGVSGFSTPMVFGVIGDGREEYKFGYEWGTNDMSRRHEELTKNYYRFHFAPWQATPDTAAYVLSNAVW